MPFGRIVALALLWLIVIPACVLAQQQPPSDYLLITAIRASTWNEGPSSIVQLQGPLTIQTDRAKMTADRAVIWLTPLPGTVLDQQRAEIALIGNASLEQPGVARGGDLLYVTTQVRGTVRLTANQRVAEKLSDSDLYRDARAIRPGGAAAVAVPPGPGQPRADWITQRPWLTIPPAPAPASTEPTTKPVRPSQRVTINGDLETITTADQKIAGVLSNGATIIQVKPNRDVIQLQADRVVVFTPLSSLTERSAVEKLQQIQEVATAAYLEGDVRITLSPRGAGRTEQYLRAQRVYYDLETDRAILTDAVIHTLEPQRQIPVVLRAQMVRQLSIGEYRAEGVELSTSSFATPSYSINSDRAYVRQYDTGDPRLGQRTVFDARNNTFETFGVPVFYWPWAAGSITDRGMPLRELLFGSSRGFGPGVRTRWGLFESIGRPPPEDLDISYRLDYFGDRGPAGGVDAEYGGGFVTETGKQPWNFTGDFTSYFVLDHGEDHLGKDRRVVDPDDDFRYRVLWQHQHFFPQDWQLQLRAAAVSDPTFLEEWFERDFNDGLPHDLSAYLKHQRQTEAYYILATAQPNDFVTIADLLQEQFEVERVPELGYYRIGDSFGQDRFTFFSANTVSGLHFKQSDASLADLGFRPGQSPGIPSLGLTGVTDDDVYRGDFRQEFDYPFSAGQFRIVPYVFGRYTAYSDSPDNGSINRVFVGSGVRATTALWKVDNTAFSDLLDVHRVRHVIEPQVHLFTSAQTEDRSKVFIYDEPIDAISDVSAAQIALSQRWQTKRGGAGRWRSVDFFTLNAEINFFANKPENLQVDPVTGLTPDHFRGLFFPSLPEASIARNSVNADALWRVSDATAVLADVQYNLDERTLATTSIGLAVQRDTRLSYFAGTRYIGEVNSTIASFAANYELSAKYALRFTESADLSERQNQSTSVTLVRRFDRFFMTFTAYYDAVEDDSGFRFGIYPEGLGYGLTTEQFQQVFGPQ